MQKTRITAAFLLAQCCLMAQPFTKIVDATNPVTTFTNDPRPYKGVAWIDFDGDNRTDLFVSPRFVFRNLGNGNFERLTDLPGINSAQLAAGSSWGDINNDGVPDAITASFAAKLHLGTSTSAWGQTDSLANLANYPAWDVALADADNNGLLDLLFVHAQNFHQPSPSFPCRFYLQQQDGAFQQVTGYEFTDQLAPYTIPIWSDYDLDGDMDLFIGSGPGGSAGIDYCYKNMLKETGSFALERLNTFPFNQLQDGQVYGFSDYDLDGDFDICLSNYGGAPTRLYRRNADGTFAAQSAPFTVQLPYLANVWGDLDNDGDEDVCFTEDLIAQVRYFRNDGGSFAPLGNLGSAGGRQCGLAQADYDNDGDLDFYTNSATIARALFRNDLSNSNHWAVFTLQGTESNRSAIGALVRVKAHINGTAQWQMRQVLAHNSFGGHSDLRQHFGLGAATMMDSIEVRWPSGTVQQFAGIVADKQYKIIENQGITQVSSTKDVIQTEAWVRVSPNPAHDFLQVTSNASITSVDVFDVLGRPCGVRANPSAAGWELHMDRSVLPGTYSVLCTFQGGAQRMMLFLKR